MTAAAEKAVILSNSVILERRGRFVADHKCSIPEGVTIKPDGIHPLDPCLYETTEIHRNVTVRVMKCKRCGHVEISWCLQDNTESECGVNDNG